MGNPAGMRKKKSEKRRMRFEQRLGGEFGSVLAYIPKEAREEALASIKKAEDADKAEKIAKLKAAKSQAS